MTSEQSQLSHEESIAIIQRMVREARGAAANDAFDFIFWGWLLVGVSILHYILLAINPPFEPSLVYLLMGLGGVYSWIHHSRENEQRRIKTHIDTIMGYVWGAAGVMYLFGIFFGGSVNAPGGSPMPSVVLFASGSGTFITGGVLKFKPLVFGGILLWICAIPAWFLPVQGQIAMQIAGMIAGYLIPGYMLIKKERTVDVQTA